MSGPRVALVGSMPSHEGGEHWVGAPGPDQPIAATLMLRRKPAAAGLEQALLSGTAQPLSREEAAARIGADPEDIAAVRTFLDANGLRIVNESPASRTIRVEGTVQEIDRAFGVQIGWFENAAGQRFLSYRGTISIPASLEGILVAVLGLDQRPVAHPRPEV